MKKFKSHFWYTNSQRNGIFFLACTIIAVQILYLLMDFSSEPLPNLETKAIVQFQQTIDSLKQIKLTRQTPKIFPFNPSFLTDYKGYQLGMSISEIDRLLLHRSEGKYINSTKEFQEITQVSDSLLHMMAPYFKFPEWLQKQQGSFKKEQAQTSTSSRSTSSTKDLNKATREDLKNIKGIGDKLAQRIVNYRTKLKGFLIQEQLYEVYYLDSTVANAVLDKFAILTKPAIKKIDINTASFKELLSLVYFDYNLTKKIFAYKDQVVEIQDLKELKEIEGFPLEKFDRIALYLEAK